MEYPQPDLDVKTLVPIPTNWNESKGMPNQITHPKRSVGEHIAWILFCFTSVYVVFGISSIQLISGERTPVLLGLLCTATLAGALLFGRKGALNASVSEIIISLALLSLALVSAARSEAPESSLVRALVLMGTALGGFWCGRLLLVGASRQKAFVWVCTAILIAWMAFGFSGFVAKAQITHYLQVNPHKVIGMLFLLAFAPLALLSRRTWASLAVGILLLVCLLVELYLGGSTGHVEAGVLIPMLMFGVAAVFIRKGTHAISTALIVLLVVFGIASHYVYRVSQETFTREDFQAYRVEAYPFSWHIAKKHPFLGIGLRTPREQFLEDYDKFHPGLTNDKLAWYVRTGVTPENIFLAFGTGTGIPFLAIYIFALAVLLVRLIRCVFRPPPELSFSPLVLLIPISGSLIHAVMVDTLLYASMSWFFHIFLGMIPRHAGATETARLDWKTVGLRAAYVSVAIAVGILVGTHQIFSTGVFPTAAEVSRQAKRLPVLSLIFADQNVDSKLKDETGKESPTPKSRLRSVRSPAPEASHESGVPIASRAKTGPGDGKIASARSKPGDPPAIGSLLVEMEGYKGSPVKWAVMVILNDSNSMGVRSDSWTQGRLFEAVRFLKRLRDVLPDGSEMAVRAFPDAVPLRLEGKALSVRVSRILRNWSGPPIADVLEGLENESPDGKTNPCAATIRAVRNDFRTMGNASPRVVILTDCDSGCSTDWVRRELNRPSEAKAVKVDVIAFGPKIGETCSWAAVAENTKGSFLKIAGPDSLYRVLADFRMVLNTPELAKIDISGANKTYQTYPGKRIELPTGSYSLRLPAFGHLPDSRRVLSNVQVMSGDTRVVRVSVRDGQLQVR